MPNRTQIGPNGAQGPPGPAIGAPASLGLALVPRAWDASYISRKNERKKIQSLNFWAETSLPPLSRCLLSEYTAYETKSLHW